MVYLISQMSKREAQRVLSNTSQSNTEQRDRVRRQTWAHALVGYLLTELSFNIPC